MVRRSLLIAVAYLALAGAWLSAADSKRTFQLANKSSSAIAEIALTPSGQDDWSDSILGGDELGAGEAARFSFEEPDRGALYDLLIVDDEGEEHLFEGIPLPSVAGITVLAEDGSLTLKIERGR